MVNTETTEEFVKELDLTEEEKRKKPSVRSAFS